MAVLVGHDDQNPGEVTRDDGKRVGADTAALLFVAQLHQPLQVCHQCGVLIGLRTIVVHLAQNLCDGFVDDG